jgi:hypothetical protein
VSCQLAQRSYEPTYLIVGVGQPDLNARPLRCQKLVRVTPKWAERGSDTPQVGFEVAERLFEGDDSPIVILVSSREIAIYRGRLAESPARGFIARGDLSAKSVAAVVNGV